MDKQRQQNPRHTSFSSYLMLVIIITVLGVIAFSSFFTFVLAEKELQDNMHLLEQNTEDSVTSSLRAADNYLKIYDMSLNEDLRTGFVHYLKEYERAGRNPDNMDLEGVKEALGGTVDLYVINREGVISHTTCPNDLGLDFSQYPEFYQQILVLMGGEDFAADRIVKEITTGKERKYAYMPTPDHDYLLELGVTVESLDYAEAKEYYYAMRQDLKSLNPYLKEVRFFDVMGNEVGEMDDESVVMDVPPLVSKTLKDRVSQENRDEEKGLLTRYFIVDLRSPEYPSDRSILVELTYNTALIDNKLSSLFTGHLIVTIMAILFSICIAYLASRRMTIPIEAIVGDIDTIARGNLDHTIRDVKGKELHSLTQSINTMVVQLKENIKKIQHSEEQIREHSEQLEEKVTLRTRELNESNARANLYLDIMTHDINNANMASYALVELMDQHLEGEMKKWSGIALKNIQKSAQILRNVSTIRRIQDHYPPLIEVDLDRVIRSEIARYPGIDISYENSNATVMADDLLSEIFSNLIGNSVKFVDSDGHVEIRVEESSDDELLISLEDTGPGVPDEEKLVIFERFSQGSGGKRGDGLGLFIVRSLIERYSGSIWAEDRVAGTPGEGLAVRFTLKKSTTRVD